MVSSINTARRVIATLLATTWLVSAAPFRIISVTPKVTQSGFSPATGGWLVSFNDAVKPSAAVNYISFCSSTGQRVAAHLESPQMTAPASQHQLIASPISALPPGKGWQLSILKGLPNATTSARTLEDSSYEIGEIEPFKITEINAADPRKVVIHFNEAISEITPIDFLQKCIEIKPHPEELHATLEESQILLSGNFKDADQYIVTMRPPFTSKNGHDLAGPLTVEIKFRP